MRKGIFLVVSIIGLFCLSGCDNSTTPGNTGKNLQEISEDISASRQFNESYEGYTIDEVEIIKRQTDIENKSDKIFAMLTVNNDTEGVKGYIDYILDYGLYNEGWILDGCEVNYEGTNSGVKLIPTKAPEISTEELAQALSSIYSYGSSTYIEVYDTNIDLETGIADYMVTAKSIHRYMTETINATVSYDCRLIGKLQIQGFPTLTNRKI